MEMGAIPSQMLALHINISLSVYTFMSTTDSNLNIVLYRSMNFKVQQQTANLAAVMT